jgi:hypothetical protein
MGAQVFNEPEKDREKPPSPIKAVTLTVIYYLNYLACGARLANIWRVPF